MIIMKKMHLIFAGALILAMGLASCSSEEAAVKEENTVRFEFAKTPEMLGFEKAFKDYMLSKHQSGTSDTKSKAGDGQVAKEKAIQLLNSLGKAELGSQQVETEQLLLVAMKEYSKKLTQMYNQRNK